MMSSDGDRFFVITGGPGSGKSTLIEALKVAGFSASDEAGRQIIKDQMSISGRALPWIDPPLFAEMMLSRDMQSYRAQSGRTGRVIFDRGVPDVIGYLRLLGLPVPPHMTKAAELFRYNRRVFIAPPWPEIFEQDSERKQTPEEAERTCESVARTYTGLGYELLELPRAPVEARVRFIVAQVS
jgi:predicted ATPase